MHVVIPSVPAVSALAWLDHARKVVAELPGHPQLGSTLSADVLEGFQRYLDEWLWAADTGPVFRWEGDVEADVACHLVHHWHAVTVRLIEDAGGIRRPAEGEVFYRALVDAVTDALALDEHTHAFGEQLRACWPGVGPVA